MTHQSEPPIDR